MSIKKNPRPIPDFEAKAHSRAQLEELIPDMKKRLGDLHCAAGFDTRIPVMATEIVHGFQFLNASARFGLAPSYETVVRLALTFCAAVEQTRLLNQERMPVIAEQMTAWPALLSYHRKRRKNTLAWVSALPLATDLKHVAPPTSAPTPDIASPSSPPPLPTNLLLDHQIAIMCGEIVARCEVLKTGAYAGDPRAFEALVRIAALFCEGVTASTPIHAALAAEIATKTTAWPALLSADSEQRQKATNAVEQLPLGTALPLTTPDHTDGLPTPRPPRIGRQRKLYDPESKTNHIVEAELLRMKLENPARYGIPRKEVTRGILDDWFKEMWARLRVSGDFETGGSFRDLGEPYADYRARKRAVKSGEYEAHLREGARQRLREAFDQIFRY